MCGRPSDNRATGPRERNQGPALKFSGYAQKHLAALFKQVARQVGLMRSLLDHDDASAVLVVEAFKWAYP